MLVPRISTPATPILKLAKALALLYDVREDDRLVEVLSMRHVPVPPPSGD